MKSLVRKTAVLAVMFLAVVSLSAQPYGQGKGQGYGQKGMQGKQMKQNKMERMAIMLDLSDEQKTKIESLRIAHQKKMLPIQNEMAEKRAKMVTLQTAENVDMKAINTLVDEMSTLRTKMIKEKIAMHQEVRNTLTEDQRIKFDTHFSQKGQRGMKGKGGKGSGCMMGRM